MNARRSVHGLALGLVGAVLGSALAQAGTPVAPLASAASHATAAAEATAAEFAAQRRAVQDRYAEIVRAEQMLANVRRSPSADEKTLAAGMDLLARGKAGYDAALARERTAMIANVQAEAAARAARQALTDAQTEWHAEGEALQKAAERAAAGEIAPTPREQTACLDRDCSPVSPREHTALVLMGAVSDAFAPAEWPAAAAAEMTLLPADAVRAKYVHGLRTAAADAARRNQQAAAAVNEKRAPLAAALGPWESALQRLLEAYFRPAPGHSAETLHAALDDMFTAADSLAQPAESYRIAAAEADAAKAKVAPTAMRLEQAIAQFGDMGRAVVRAAHRSAEGDSLAVTPQGFALCRAGTCEPAAGVEAAAFIVIGAASPEAEARADKTFAAVLERTAAGGWAFRLPR